MSKDKNTKMDEPNNIVSIGASLKEVGIFIVKCAASIALVAVVAAAFLFSSF